LLLRYLKKIFYNSVAELRRIFFSLKFLVSFLSISEYRKTAAS
jgi:hypothetical protein